MITAKNKILLAQKLFDTEDKRILKAVESILNPSEQTIDLTSAEKKELDKRLADHKAGKLKYYTIDEVRKAVLSAIKK
jgi:putative addiction module component (TIGR02574 family)